MVLASSVGMPDHFKFHFAKPCCAGQQALFSPSSTALPTKSAEGQERLQTV
jgi:hypothetical protein